VNTRAQIDRCPKRSKNKRHSRAERPGANRTIVQIGIVSALFDRRTARQRDCETARLRFRIFRKCIQCRGDIRSGNESDSHSTHTLAPGIPNTSPDSHPHRCSSRERALKGKWKVESGQEERLEKARKVISIFCSAVCVLVRAGNGQISDLHLHRQLVGAMVSPALRWQGRRGHQRARGSAGGARFSPPRRQPSHSS